MDTAKKKAQKCLFLKEKAQASADRKTGRLAGFPWFQ